MKINSINNQQNFKGKVTDTAVNFITKHPVAIAGLAGSSVIAQKIVMSGSEAVIGPAMDIGIGKVITKATGEKDNRTNQSSKVQAVRTSAQAIGGTITGVIIRGICIAAATALCMKAGKEAGNAIGEIITDKGKIKPEDAFAFQDNAQKWGKNIGGAAAIIVMMFTNFLVDAPFINWINKKMTGIFMKDKTAKAPQKPETAKTEQAAKEAK